MKEAVHRLRNQLRRKTKKPSTISVLKAAKQEIDVNQMHVHDNVAVAVYALLLVASYS